MQCLETTDIYSLPVWEATRAKPRYQQDRLLLGGSEVASPGVSPGFGSELSILVSLGLWQHHTSLPPSTLVVFSVCLCVSDFPSYKDEALDEAPLAFSMTSSQWRRYWCQDPISKESHILRFQVVVNLEGTLFRSGYHPQSPDSVAQRRARKETPAFRCLIKSMMHYEDFGFALYILQLITLGTLCLQGSRCTEDSATGRSAS